MVGAPLTVLPDNRAAGGLGHWKVLVAQHDRLDFAGRQPDLTLKMQGHLLSEWPDLHARRRIRVRPRLAMVGLCICQADADPQYAQFDKQNSDRSNRIGPATRKPWSVIRYHVISAAKVVKPIL